MIFDTPKFTAETEKYSQRSRFFVIYQLFEQPATRSDKIVKPLSSLLDPVLLARSKRYDRLSLRLRQSLPAECDGHYAITGIHQQELVIVADSPVWATRLRQLAPQILALASGQPTVLRHVQIKTRLPTSEPLNIQPAVRTVRRELSPRASQQINSAAAGIADPSLKNALLKLARRHKKTGV